jgi:hypothetical protein
MPITTTRTDCVRDNRAVICPNATLLGFGTSKVKRGNWIEYETSEGARYVGRVISRVTCEGVRYIELAEAAENLTHVYIRWIKPEQVRECRAAPPRAVFEFLAMDAQAWNDIEAVHGKIAYGVSDMRDQLGARREAED